MIVGECKTRVMEGDTIIQEFADDIITVDNGRSFTVTFKEPVQCNAGQTIVYTQTYPVELL